jgi:hypothetical protein
MPRRCYSFSLENPFPSSLKTLIYQYVKGELLPGVLPEGLEHLEIFNGFTGNTGELLLPPSITYLDLGKDYGTSIIPYLGGLPRMLRNEYINRHMAVTEWAPLLTKIKMNNCSDLQAKFDTMPSTLTELEYNVGPYRPFISEDLPYSVRSLTLHVDGDYCPMFHGLPPCLRSLTLYLDRRTLVLENDLPESITNLKIIDVAAARLELRGKFPPNLQYFSLNCIADRMEVAFPSSLTFLDAPLYYYPFDEGILPDSLTTLNLNGNYSKIDLSDSWLPESLDFVNIGSMKIRVWHSL